MRMNKALAIAILSVLVMSGMAGMVYASANPLSSLQVGSFQVDPRGVQNWHVSAAGVEKWFTASWGTNIAEKVGAVDYPYQFLYGNLFMNGQLESQSITVNVVLNWSMIKAFPAVALLALPGDGATIQGAPTGEAISTGIGSGAIGYFSGYPFHIYIETSNGSALATTMLYTSTSTSDYQVTLQPDRGYNGTIYIEIYSMMYTEWNAQPVKYFPLYVGVGQFTQLTANVQGSTSVVKGSGPAFLNFTFNAGNWSVNFDKVLNGNPANESATNLQVLQTYHFTYSGTGGAKQLIYNFTSINSPGIYVWMINESVTKYGSTYVVHDLKTKVPPKVLMWMSPGKLDGQETVSVTVVSNTSQTNITVYLSIWYGTDEYMVPPAGASNVLLYNSPYSVISGQNLTLSFRNSMDGQLNLQVIANASGDFNLTRDFTTIGNNVTGPPGGNVSAWFIWPPWDGGPVNQLLLLGGGILILYSLGASLGNVEVDDRVRKAERIRNRELSMGEKVAYRMPANLTSAYSAHFGAAIFLLALSVINWNLVLTAITSSSLSVLTLIGGVTIIPRPQNVRKGHILRVIAEREEGGILLDGVIAFIILLLFILIVVDVFHGNLHMVESAWARFWGGRFP